MSATGQDRAALAAGLRRLADVVEAGHASRLPVITATFAIFHPQADAAKEMPAIGEALGCPLEAHVDRGTRDWYELRGSLAGIKVAISAPAAKVCTPGALQVVEVPGWVPSPAIAALITPAEVSR